MLHHSKISYQAICLRCCLIIAAVLLGYWLTAAADSSANAVLDRIVAVVDQQVITQRQLDWQIAQLNQRIKEMGVESPGEQVVRQKALEQLISRSLQLQLADRAGIRASDKAVDDALQRVMRQQHSTKAELKSQLAKEGMTLAAYRKEVRKDLTISQLQQQMVAEKVELTEANISEAWQDYQQQWQQHTQCHLKDIFIAVPEGANQQQIKTAQVRAQQLAQLQRQGKLPPVMADSDFVVKDWEKQLLSSLPAAFAKAAMSMKEGQVHAPIQTGDGFHVLQLLSKQEPEQRLTREQIANQLHRQKFIEAIKDWLAEQRHYAYIKVFDE